MKRSQLVVPTAAACLALLFSGCTSSSDDVAPDQSTPPTTSPGTTQSADEAAALAVINQAYAAFNSGDAAAWAEARSAGSYDSAKERKAEVAEATTFFKARIDDGVQFTAIQCESHGDGQWPGIEDSDAPAVQGYYFTCAHYDGGGGTHTTKWVVADGKIVAAGSD